MIHINTFTCIYDELEDRIRLSINYQDPLNRIDFMITRRFVLKLFPVLEENYYKFFGMPQNHDEIQKANSNTKTDGATFQLIMDKSELLHKVDLKFDEKIKRLTLIFYGKNDTASALLDGDSYKYFLKILQTSVPSYSWGIHKLIDL